MDKTKSVTGEPECQPDGAVLPRRDVADAINQVIEWMLEGHNGHSIMEAIVVKLPGHSPSELLTMAAKHFETTSKAESNVLHGWCLEATRDLYRRLIEIGDYPNALRAIKQLRDLTK